MILRKQPSTWITICRLPSRYPILRCTLVINQLVEKYIKSGLPSSCSQCSFIQLLSTSGVNNQTIIMNKFTVVCFLAVIALSQVSVRHHTLYTTHHRAQQTFFLKICYWILQIVKFLNKHSRFWKKNLPRVT